jgi:hypothetical protein
MIDLSHSLVLIGIDDENVASGSVLPSTHKNRSIARW